LWGSTKPAMSTPKLIKRKMRKLVCSQQCPQSITCLLFSKHLSNKVKENNGKKQKRKKWATLDPTLHFGFPNH
jgi:hypothetical protein